MFALSCIFSLSACHWTTVYFLTSREGQSILDMKTDQPVHDVNPYQISIFPHQNPPFLGPAGKSIKLIVIGICLDNTAAAQRNISGCRYNCEVCEMKLTWKTYSTVLFHPFYDIYSLAYSSNANMKKSLIYTIITLKTATHYGNFSVFNP